MRRRRNAAAEPARPTTDFVQADSDSAPEVRLTGPSLATCTARDTKHYSWLRLIITAATSIGANKGIRIGNGSRADMRKQIALLAALLSFVTACGEPEPDSAASEPDAVTGAAALEIARTPYQESSVRNGGSVTGTVELVRDVATDTAVELPEGADECGTGTIRVPLIHGSGRLVAEVIVWLDDARAGKPLPETRRFTIASARCGFEPRVQAAIKGGMLNVISNDAIEHRTRFMSASNGKTIETVLQHDAGAVVPVETVLLRSGRVLVRSDLHTWMRGWIQVFDHPYFTVTGAAGGFQLDDVPPGRYRLFAWHPKLGQRDTTVSVDAARPTGVVIRF